MLSLSPVSPAVNGRTLGFVCALAAACMTACQSKPPASAPAAAVSADTWAVVDGRQITRDEVEKAYRRSREGSQALSEEETLAGKLALLNDLIVQDILMAKAAALKLEVPQNELDAAYENAKKNVPDATYQQELAKRNLTAADMKEGLRRELLTQKLIDQEIASKVAVSEKEITDFFNANRAQFNIAEESYHIAQIVITPVREAQIGNGTGDDATTPQAAVAKVRMLMERLKAGASFRDLAMGYSEDPESAPRGGDMGFLPVSRLKQAPPQLRDAVLNKTPGSVNVATAGGAYTLVLVVAHEPAGQRDLSTPGMRERITETLRGRKEQLTRMAYLTTIRNDAQVNNYLARRLSEAKGAAAPNLVPSAPAGK
jgi:peptidyl-prolyl cis-trans isomerase SurA